MNIKTLAVFVLSLHVSFIGVAQSDSQAATNAPKIISQQKSGQDQIKHTDSTYGYSVDIPNWWNIKETPSPNFFGGTLPEIGISKSALLFKAFEKEKFKTFQNFENWVIAGYNSGDTPKWSNDHKVLLKQSLTGFKDLGKAYKVQLKANDTFYISCYILVETSKSYLWADLTATRET